MRFYTYIYRDPSRQHEPIYVGKGHARRAWHHLKRKGRHPFVQRLRCMRKNNIDPSIEIIDALDESHAFLMEECLIQIIGRKDLGRGPLLNLTDGGDGVSNPSVDTRIKIGSANKGRKRSLETIEKIRINGIRPSFKGRHHTDETKDKISNANTGKVRTQEFKDNLSRLHTGKVAWNKGLPGTTTGKKLNTYKCLHCDVYTTGGNLVRWHNENCKLKE